MVNVVKFSEFANVTLTNTSNMLVGVSSNSGGINFKSPFTNSWTTANRPTPPYPGLSGYNTDLGQIEYWNGAAWIQLSAGGSGSVNLGSINQLAYYATTGTAVSGLMSANDSVLITNPSGAPNWSTSLPASLTIPQPNIVGVTTNSNAAVGSVGELISSVVSSGSAVAIPNAISANVTSISLTAGDWDVWGNVFVIANVSMISVGVWISQVSATPPDASLLNGFTTGSAFTQLGLSVPQLRFSLTSTTTIYLSVDAQFTVGVGTARGGIYARRRR